MCSNLLVCYYYLSCLCLYRLALCKNKYISRSATTIYSAFEAISKRRFLHRKKTNTSCRRDHSQQQKEVSTPTEGGIFVSLSPPAAMHTILVQAPAFSIAWAKRGFYTGKISYSALHLCLRSNALPLSQKRDFYFAQFVTATDSIQKKLWKQRFFHGKKEVSTCLFWLIGL